MRSFSVVSARSHHKEAERAGHSQRDASPTTSHFALPGQHLRSRDLKLGWPLLSTTGVHLARGRHVGKRSENSRRDRCPAFKLSEHSCASGKRWQPTGSSHGSFVMTTIPADISPRIQSPPKYGCYPTRHDDIRGLSTSGPNRSGHTEHTEALARHGRAYSEPSVRHPELSPSGGFL